MGAESPSDADAEPVYLLDRWSSRGVVLLGAHAHAERQDLLEVHDLTTGTFAMEGKEQFVDLAPDRVLEAEAFGCRAVPSL